MARALRLIAPLAISVAILIPAALSHRAKDQTPAPRPKTVKSRPVSSATAAIKSEEVLRLNNFGVAEMEQFRFAKAAEYFEQAQTLDRGFLPATVNLAIALYYDRKNAEAEKVLRSVIARDPRQPEALFVLSLLMRASGKDEEALKLMKSVMEVDPKDAPALYFAGSLEASLHSYNEALRHFRAALERDPVNVSVYYALAKTMVQKGDTAEAEKIMAQFQEWKARGTGTSFGNQYGEQGRYAQVIRISGSGEAPDSSGSPPHPRFAEATISAGIQFTHGGPKEGELFTTTGVGGSPAFFGSGAVFFDFDGDQWPDLLLANASADGSARPALFRNSHDGTFSPLADAGIDFKGVGMGAAVGDYDNDGRPDLFLSGFHGSTLYHNEGNGRFRNVTSILSPGLQEAWALSAAFSDLDHDGDLDLFVTCAGANGAGRNLLYRNNGDGTFAEIAAAAGVGKAGFPASLAIMDFNDSRDIDLLLIDSKLRLFSNNRDGSFKDVGATAGLQSQAGILGVAVGDLDGDGQMDICLPGGAEGMVRILWYGGEGYQSQEIPVKSGSPFTSARAFDYDNDGDLDILLVGDELHLLENLGRRKFQDVSVSAGLDKIKALNARAVAIADFDRDGDLDLLITRCGFAPLLLRNDGGNRNHAFRLTLEGKSDNRTGIGSKVEWAAGGLWQHREVDGNLGYLSQGSTDLLLGLGHRTTPDFVRILWPTGVLQAEIPPRSAHELHLAELDRKGTSCPILYAWDGRQYSFVSDFLGGCAIGYLEEPGRYGVPDTDEYVKISHDQLVPRGGRISLKMTNQLEEVILFDMVRLLAVDHPATAEVFPNERLLSAPPFPEFRIYAATSPRGVVSARDGQGNDWTTALSAVDRNYAGGFRLLPYKGYSEEHSLTLDLGDLRSADRVLLLLDGWIDYATSSSNFAASQAGLKLVPPFLQAQEGDRWRTILADMGFPAGLPKTITVDLTGKVPLAAHTRIRVVTNMRIYWDRIRIETGPEEPRVRVATLQPATARTSWIGYPQQWSPDGVAPFGYDFAHRDAVAPWKTHRGEYTPLGNVLDLLKAVDDRYVILSHGEAITADFSAAELPALPAGWVRDWLLHVDGFGKDMDIHSQYPDRLDPLPRHRDLPYRLTDWRLSSDAVWEAFAQTYLVRRP